MKGIAASLFLQITIWAQTAPVVLSIDVENRVFYQFDISDYVKLASEPVRTNPPAVKTFASTLGIADIVAINGKPARGTWTLRATVVNLGGGCQCGPEPVSAASGTAIADTTRNNHLDVVWDILTPDGTPVGSIMASGASGGMPAPGSPLVVTNSDLAITGGTGAFLGMRGQGGLAQVLAADRRASMSEDPSMRRVYGGGARRIVLLLLPLIRPEVIVTANGPAVVHSTDFGLVTSARPARQGEILSAFATGLGPTRPGVDPGTPFPSQPIHQVNSPVEVTVNGKSADVLGTAGSPGSIGGYQVNFRVPEDTTSGTATVRLSSAWIPGPELKIAIQ
jgi:hypothetical protein